jgi:hypothetical protein
MVTMPDILTIRETLEYTVEVPSDPDEHPHWTGSYHDATTMKSVSREIVDRRHEPDYVLRADTDRGLYLLTEDGQEVFANRSQDAVYERYKELTGQPDLDYFHFDDIDDPDKSWRPSA